MEFLGSALLDQSILNCDRSWGAWVLHFYKAHGPELRRSLGRERKDFEVYLQVKKRIKCRLCVDWSLECPLWEKPLGVEIVGASLEASAVDSAVDLLLNPFFVFFSMCFRILQSLLRSCF